ncbi:MAG: PEP-CTERM sorting domain-containing protein [Phycisphaerae bacterium]
MRTFRVEYVGVAALVACCGVVVPSARANVDLGFDPTPQTVGVGDIVEIGLMAISDDDFFQSIGAMEVILNWDTDVLRLIDHVDNGPYEWLMSSFPDDGVFDGLNDTFLDGDALYRALAQFAPAPPAFAPPQGLLVTTLRFEAIAPSPLTDIVIPPTAGFFTETIVLDGFIPGLNVTGELGSAQITVVPEPATLTLLAIASVAVIRRRLHAA